MDLPPQPPGAAHVTFTVAALVALGGAAGYARKRSVRSLAAGGVFGGAFGLAGYFISTGEVERGYKYATLSSLALAGAMGYRAIRFRQPMPAGLLAGVGAASAVYHGWKLQELLEE